MVVYELNFYITKINCSKCDSYLLTPEHKRPLESAIGVVDPLRCLGLGGKVLGRSQLLQRFAVY